MTAEDLAFLEHAVDRVVALKLRSGEMLFAEIVMVVNEPPTPDVFVLRCEREPDGAFVATSTAGESLLLEEIEQVAAIPGVEYE